MMRHRLRSTIDRVASSTGLLRLCEQRMAGGVTILMYHRILPLEPCRTYPLASLVIPQEAFAAQVAWLAAHCDVRTVAGALDAQRTGPKKDWPIVALTFDDGYADNYDIAAPIMEEAGCRGTFFVTTGFVSSGAPLWFDRAADAWMRLSEADQVRLVAQLPDATNEPGVRGWMEGLKGTSIGRRDELVTLAEARAGSQMDSARYMPMTVDQIRNLHARGHEIASHTVTHPILPHLNNTELQTELHEAKRSITEWTGQDMCGFCYPNGDVDVRVAQMVAQNAHAYACTTQSGINRSDQDPFLLRRLAITMPRTTRASGDHHELGFRGEISRMRELWRVT